MKKYFKKKSVAIVVALFCMFLWGSAFPVLKLSYQELGIAASDYVSKIYLAGLRFFTAGIVVSVYYFLFTKDKKQKVDFKFLIFLGLIQTTIQYLFFYIGVGNTTGVKSAILQSSSTFFIVLLSHYLYQGDRLTKRKVLALIFGFGGILVANLTQGFDLNFSFQGEGFLLIAALANSFGTVYVKSKGGKMNPFMITMGQMFIGSLFLILPGKILMEGSFQWTGYAIGLFIYSAFLSGTAFSLWYELLKYHPSGELSIYNLFVPIFGSFLSLIILPEESLSLHLLVGLVLVCIGMVILNWKPKEVHYEKNENR